MLYYCLCVGAIGTEEWHFAVEKHQEKVNDLVHRYQELIKEILVIINEHFITKKRTALNGGRHKGTVVKLTLYILIYYIMDD